MTCLHCHIPWVYDDLWYMDKALWTQFLWTKLYAGQRRRLRGRRTASRKRRRKHQRRKQDQASTCKKHKRGYEPELLNFKVCYGTMWLANQNCIITINGSGNSPIVTAPDSWSKGCRFNFKSPQEQWENIFLQGQLSVHALISVSIPPLCYHSTTQKTLVILPKVQVAGCS